MLNKTSFEDFFNSLMQTNRSLDFFTDFDKAYKNRNKLELNLNILNNLLGKDDLLGAIKFLFTEGHSEIFADLPILIGVRKNKENIVLDENQQPKEMQEFLKTPESIFKFIQLTGLEIVFKDKNVKDLKDYVFGVEVGLDSNGRKNRGGKIMENHLINIFTQNKIDFKTQVKTDEIKQIQDILGSDIKKFDFTVYTKTKTFLIETNFYNTQGSKPNETDRAYIMLADKFKDNKEFAFIWITDGKGWGSSKNKLEEAYKKVEMYNLANLNNFIEKVKCQNS